MIIQVFVFAVIFLVLGVVFIVKKKKILGWMFVLLSVFAFLMFFIVISLYPQTLPF
ncbi:MAG: hypothetical protein U5Q03_03170 [Bacteroidota bacterium]|nr:hypothetical protein [Bacteroidota bacterium]